MQWTLNTRAPRQRAELKAELEAARDAYFASNLHPKRYLDEQSPGSDPEDALAARKSDMAALSAHMAVAIAAALTLAAAEDPKELLCATLTGRVHLSPADGDAGSHLSVVVQVAAKPGEAAIDGPPLQPNGDVAEPFTLLPPKAGLVRLPE